MDTLAIITIKAWTLILLFWIPVHGFSGFFKRLGVLTYITPLVTWLPVAHLIDLNRVVLLSHRLEIFPVLKVSGWIIFTLGMILQLWTLRLLGALRIIGLAEVTTLIESRIITGGPFSVVRHPTYVSHTIMFFGVFLITGVTSVGIITLFDLLIVNLLLIPLEDRELIGRFGDEYRAYKNRVPAYFPWKHTR